DAAAGLGASATAALAAAEGWTTLAALPLDFTGEAAAGTGAASGSPAEAPPFTSNVTSGAWTFTFSPGLPNSFTILPALGLGISTSALSVRIDASGWCSATVSPTFTNHFTISP